MNKNWCNKISFNGDKLNKRKGIKPNKDENNLVNAKDLERNLRKVIESNTSKSEEYSKEFENHSKKTS